MENLLKVIMNLISSIISNSSQEHLPWGPAQHCWLIPFNLILLFTKSSLALSHQTTAPEVLPNLHDKMEPGQETLKTKSSFIISNKYPPYQLFWFSSCYCCWNWVLSFSCRRGGSTEDSSWIIDLHGKQKENWRDYKLRTKKKPYSVRKW